ncbi:MAG: PQQ-binding-like beta-propeller repeat protein [Planctomycetes bacterium]|nr:PQQ-binding-like beta-propeller repeat protein [Planctomycetota bacterium]
MSTSATAAAPSSRTNTSAAASAQKPLRLWPLAIPLAVFWLYTFGCDYVEMTSLQRFLSRLIVHAGLLLFCLVWWLGNRRIARRDKWIAVGLTVAGFFATLFVADKTMSAFGLLFGLCYLFTCGTLWLLLTRQASHAIRWGGLYAIVVLVWAYHGLVRWEGLDGAQNSKYAWRWTTTKEQKFLTERDDSTATTKPTATPPQAAAPLVATPTDWTQFRGPAQNNQIHGVPSADWSAAAPQPIWRHRVGPAWSSVIVIGDNLFTQEQRGEQEAVVCYDAATGNERWVHTDASRFNEPVSGAGPRATPAFQDGNVFTIGGKGVLNCLDAATGKPRWAHNLETDAGAIIPQWGYSNSPFVVDNLVVAYLGGDGDNGLVAYRADSGAEVWRVAAGKGSYSTPQLLTLLGQRQLLLLSERGAISHEIATGRTLWELPLFEVATTPFVQPQAINDHEFLAQTGEGIGLVSVARDVDQWTATKRWTSKALKPSLDDFVVVDGNIYGFDDGIFGCVDLETGKRRWKRGRYGHGQVLLLADAKQLLVISETGEAVLLAANPERLEELGRFKAIEGKTWNHPVIAHGRLYTRNDEELACFALEPTSRR